MTASSGPSHRKGRPSVPWKRTPTAPFLCATRARSCGEGSRVMMGVQSAGHGGGDDFVWVLLDELA